MSVKPPAITPVHVAGLILWDYVQRAHLNKPFLMWSEDYVPYCPIKFEVLR